MSYKSVEGNSSGLLSNPNSRSPESSIKGGSWSGMWLELAKSYFEIQNRASIAEALQIEIVGGLCPRELLFQGTGHLELDFETLTLRLVTSQRIYW